MAIREFTDSRGQEWRVWDVTPAQMHPVTRGEDYMADLQDGWLAFESAREKRRLECPYPTNWRVLPLADLEALCRRASPVVRRKRSPSGEHRAVTAAEIEQSVVAGSAPRTFLSPGGREWTVRIHECFDSEGEPVKVLRFTAGDIVVELPSWPNDWHSATVEQYALMLLDAAPPRRVGKGPQRRRDDRARGT